MPVIITQQMATIATITCSHSHHHNAWPYKLQVHTPLLLFYGPATSEDSSIQSDGKGHTITRSLHRPAMQHCMGFVQRDCTHSLAVLICVVDEAHWSEGLYVEVPAEKEQQWQRQAITIRDVMLWQWCEN